MTWERWFECDTERGLDKEIAEAIGEKLNEGHHRIHQKCENLDQALLISTSPEQDKETLQSFIHSMKSYEPRAEYHVSEIIDAPLVHENDPIDTVAIEYNDLLERYEVKEDY